MFCVIPAARVRRSREKSSQDRQFESLKGAVDRCVAELGGIDFVVCVATSIPFHPQTPELSL